MAVRSRFVGIAVLMLVSGCTHGVVDGPPTTPTPAVTLRALTVTPVGGGTLLQGHTAPILTSGSTLGLGAWAQYSDGTAKYVAATWTTSDANVIAIDGESIRAVNRGTAMLTASAEGKTASESFRVEPNMAGTWSGNLVVDQCGAGSGSMGELICNDVPSHPRGLLAVGVSVPITLQIQKSGDALTAAVTSGEWRGTLSGTDRGSNFMSFSGSLTGNRTTITIVFWNSQAKTDVMEGQIGFEVRIDNVPSNAAVVAHFENVTRR